MWELPHILQYPIRKEKLVNLSENLLCGCGCFYCNATSCVSYMIILLMEQIMSIEGHRVLSRYFLAFWRKCIFTSLTLEGKVFICTNIWLSIVNMLWFSPHNCTSSPCTAIYVLICIVWFSIVLTWVIWLLIVLRDSKGRRYQVRWQSWAPQRAGLQQFPSNLWM